MPTTEGLLKKLLMITAIAVLVLQSGAAQTDKPAGGNTPDAAKTIKAAADALGMPRTGGPGGGRLPEVDAVNRMEIWGSGTSYAFGQAYKPDGPWPAFKTEYHVALGYNPPAMRVEMTRTNPDGVIQGGGGLPLAAPQHTFQTVRDKYAWNESELGGGLVPGKGTATPAMG